MGPPSRPVAPYSLPEVAGVAGPDVGEKIKEVANREEKHGRVITCERASARDVGPKINHLLMSHRFFPSSFRLLLRGEGRKDGGRVMKERERGFP